MKQSQRQKVNALIRATKSWTNPLRSRRRNFYRRRESVVKAEMKSTLTGKEKRKG
jgi:hypothetical protein